MNHGNWAHLKMTALPDERENRLCGEDQPGFCPVLQLRVSVTPDSTLSSLGAFIRHLQQGTMVAQLLALDPKVTCRLRLPRK